EPGIEEILRQYARPRGRFAAERWVRGFSGFAFAWPWFDGFSAWVLRRLYFPASRLWAAAQLAEGDPPRFWDVVPMQALPQHANRLATALAAFDRARARANALDAEWQRVFFGPEESSANYRRAVEAARLDSRHAYNVTRRLFLFLLSNEVPCARPEHPMPAEMAEAYGQAQQELAP